MEISLQTKKGNVLIRRLKFGAGPAPLPTSVLERGAAVSHHTVYVLLAFEFLL